MNFQLPTSKNGGGQRPSGRTFRGNPAGSQKDASITHDGGTTIPKSKIRNRKSGLTLVEVMLALVIIGTGMVALVTAAGRCIGVARQAKNFETARELLARVEVEKPMLLEEEVEDIAGDGTFDSPYSSFKWKRTIEEEGFEEDGLWRVVTEISWTEDKKARSEAVTTLIYWPEDKEGGSFERAP